MAKSNFARLGLVAAICVVVLGYRFVQDQVVSVAEDHNRPVAKKAIQFDRYGDPLPDGAVSRLGTVRWRHAAQTIAFSPDGKYFAACGYQANPRVYDAHSGQFLRSIDTRAVGLHFSLDSKELITLEISDRPPFVRFVHSWDVSTGKEGCRFPINGQSVTWSGKFLVTISYGDRAGSGISIWDLESGKEFARLNRPVEGLPILAPNGKTLALLYRKKLYLVDALNGKELHSLPMSIASTVVFGSDSKTLVFTDNGQVCVWDVASGDIVRRLEITKDRIAILAISPDGRYLAAASDWLYVWDLAAGKLLHKIEDTRVHGLGLLAFSGDGKTIASQAPLLHPIRRWDVISGKELSLTDVPQDPVHRMAFSPDGKRVIFAFYLHRSFRQEFVIWDIDSAKPTQFSQTFDSKRIAHFVSSDNLMSPNLFGGWNGQKFPTCSPDGKTIPVVLVGSEKRSTGPHKGDPRQRINHIHGMMIGLWDVRYEFVVRSFEIDIEWSSECARSKDDQGLLNLVLSPDRKLLAGMTVYGNSIFVWDLANGTELRRWDLRGNGSMQGHAITFSRDGKELISSGTHGIWPSNKGKIAFRVHDLATGKERAKVDCAFGIDAGEAISGPVFASDRLAAVAVGKTVYLIDPMTGATLREFKGHLEHITCLAFSPDRQFLASGSYDTTILIWEVAGGQQTRRR